MSNSYHSPQLYFEVRQYSHHFEVFNLSYQGHQLLRQITRDLKPWKKEPGPNGRWVPDETKRFYSTTATHTEYRFHINMLKRFWQVVENNNVRPALYRIHKVSMYEPDIVEHIMQPHLAPRDEQPDVIRYMLDKDDAVSRMVGLRMGGGKSVCLTFAMTALKHKMLLVIKPGFIPKWMEDFKKYLHYKEEDIISVIGDGDSVKNAVSLTNFLKMVEKGEVNAKIIMMSNAGFHHWIKDYEETNGKLTKDKYPIRPQDLCEKLKIGLAAVDEVHMHFNFNFRLFTYLHVPRTICLSATLEPDDQFGQKVSRIMFPPEKRYKNQNNKTYIAASSVWYRQRNPKRFKTSYPGAGYYSHTAYEASILKNPEAFQRYVDLIFLVLEMSYTAELKPGNKAIVFCASINMCTAVTKELQKRYGKTYTVKRFIRGDPYDNLMKPDIRVATPGKAGTAVDIPGLHTNVQTVAVNSSQANLQNLGRLRELPSGQTPRFYYFVCGDIPQHVNYHKKRKALFRSWIKAYKDEITDIRL